MSEEKKPSEIQTPQDRRSGKDRRQTERRDPERGGEDKGILSTRRDDRRKVERRDRTVEKKK